jgi:hypothetical protein
MSYCKPSVFVKSRRADLPWIDRDQFYEQVAKPVPIVARDLLAPIVPDNHVAKTLLRIRPALSSQRQRS